MKRGRRFLAVLSTITLSLSLFIMPVHAEMDIFYPDPESYTCYDFFFANGFNHLILSQSNNVTYNVSLDNIGTNNGTESGQEHTTGTINSNGSSTLGSKYMTCTTNNGTSASQTYSCYFSSSSSSVHNSQSINIGFNENTYTSVNNTITQTINTDITGTIKTSDSSTNYSYLPWLTGGYNTHSSFNAGKSWNIFDDTNNDSMTNILVFFSNTNCGNLSFISSDGITSDITQERSVYAFGPNRLMVYIIHADHSRQVNVNFAVNPSSVVPLYIGTFGRMSDNMRIFSGFDGHIEALLKNGNSNTPTVVDDANNANNQMANKINQFDNIENNSVTDMNTSIQNLNVTPDILGNSKFLSSAQWVKTQFDRMTISTPVGSVLSFSLILGITLIFMGKIR